MKYRFKPTENIWESFYDLTGNQSRNSWVIAQRRRGRGEKVNFFFLSAVSAVTARACTFSAFPDSRQARGPGRRNREESCPLPILKNRVALNLPK